MAGALYSTLQNMPGGHPQGNARTKQTYTNKECYLPCMSIIHICYAPQAHIQTPAGDSGNQGMKVTEDYPVETRGDMQTSIKP